MPIVKIEPSTEYPMPFDLSDEDFDNFADKLASIGNTAELLEQLGAPVESSKENLEEEVALLDAAIDNQKITPLKSSLPAALGAAAFLRAYGQGRALDVDQVRTALTNKLLEIADCGDIKFELKAIELLGKHSDVGLLNADVIDMKPLGMDLDEELGILDADFEDILEGEEPNPE